VFLSPGLLDESLHAALYAKELRGDDVEFYASTQGWCQTILIGNFDAYKARFEDTKAFFTDRLKEGNEVSSKMIEMQLQKAHLENF